MRRALALLIPAVALGTSPARAERALLPAQLIALDSPEGQRLLLEASAREDFFHLAETYALPRGDVPPDFTGEWPGP